MKLSRSQLAQVRVMLNGQNVAPKTIEASSKGWVLTFNREAKEQKISFGRVEIFYDDLQLLYASGSGWIEYELP